MHHAYQYPDVAEQAAVVRALGHRGQDLGAGRRGEKIWPIADEDLDRSKDDKTAAVHFMRYQLTDHDRVALKAGAPIRFGIEHLAYPANAVTLDDGTRASLIGDLSD